MSKKSKIEKMIKTANELIETGATISDPRFKAWKTDVKSFFASEYGKESSQYLDFKTMMYDSPKAAGYDGENVILRNEMETTVIILQDCLNEIEEEGETMTATDFRKVFIVHGHDGELKERVARTLEKLGIEAIILSERPSEGKTIIEKLEKHTDVGAGIVLLTCDDLGRAKEATDDNYRARQNVVFEYGYLMGRLGRSHVIMIREETVEKPSDLEGIVYSPKSNWERDVIRELKAMGFSVDANKLL